MNNTKFRLGTIMIVVVSTIIGIGVTPISLQQSVNGIGGIGGGVQNDRKAPIATSGDNVYIAWWTNKTGNDEVMFRASTDGGKTFGDVINLSNSTDSNSTRVEIDSDANSAVVTWW